MSNKRKVKEVKALQHEAVMNAHSKFFGKLKSGAEARRLRRANRPTVAYIKILDFHNAQQDTNQTGTVAE